MNRFNNILVYKEREDIHDINTIFFVRSIVNNYYILHKYDTIYNEYMDIVVFPKEYVEDKMYTVNDFFKGALYIGKKGYYIDMIDIEKYIYETLIIIYKDDYNELIYDDITENIFIAPSKYQLEDFIPFENQNSNVSFKRGLGKKWNK